MKIALVAAMADNNAIGLNNKMPWHLPDDLRHFKKITLGKPVIMGRKTHESIGFTLPGRLNIVVSRSALVKTQGVQSVSSIDEAIELAKNHAIKQLVDEIMVIGGAQLYQQLLPRADRLYLTRIYDVFKADTFFPDINLDHWVCSSESYHQSNHDVSKTLPLKYAFIVYDRKNNGK